MVAFEQTVPGNLRHLQRQINEQGPLGPVSIGPGQGSIRVYDAAGDLIRMTPAAVDVRFKGAPAALTPLLERHADDILAGQERADRMDGRMDRMDTAWQAGDAAAQSRMNSMDGRMDRIDTAWQAGDAADQARMGHMDGRMDRMDAAEAAGFASVASQLADRYTIAQIDAAFASRDGRMNRMDGRMDRIDSAVATAQSTANAAKQAAANAHAAANAAQSAANAAQGAANNANNVATAALALAQNLKDRIDRGGIPM